MLVLTILFAGNVVAGKLDELSWPGEAASSNDKPLLSSKSEGLTLEDDAQRGGDRTGKTFSFFDA